MSVQRKIERSMREKLLKEFKRGYKAGFDNGVKAATDRAEINGIIKGSNDTWEIIEQMIPELEGIGPKTTEKIMNAVKEYAEKEKRKFAGLK